MADIEQKFTLDASSALDMIQLLNSGFKQLAQTMGSLPGVLGTYNVAAQNATRSTSGFGVSLETLSRVVATQAIVRGLTTIRTAVDSSFQGFIDFQRAVAEIQTIAGNVSLEDLSKQVAGLSESFNIPLLDAARAQYQILSNGFTQAADANAVFTASAKLAKVGLSDEKQAADTLSTVLNAYGKKASEAGNVSGKLIQSVIDGRQTIDQMSSAIGRVTPLAAQLGVTFEEVLASLSSLTQGGVSTSEATTQLRSALAAFIKPSDDMKAAFDKLGVATGEQLIAARGLAGAYQAVISTTDGTSLAVGKLFPNQRALTGVLRETGAAADVYAQHLSNARAASEQLQNEKFTLRVGSDTAQLDATINRLKVFFTTDIGKLLVGDTAETVNFVGTDNTILALRALIPVMGAATAAGLAYAGMATAARLKSDLAATSVKTLGRNLGTLQNALVVVTAAFAAYEAGTAIGQGLTHIIEADRDTALKAQQQLLESQRNAVSAAAQIEAASDQKSLQLVNERFLELRKGYEEQVSDAKTANDQLVSEDQSILNRIIGAHTQYATDLKRLTTTAQNDSISATKQANSLLANLYDARFTFALSKTNQFNQAVQAGQRAQSLAGQGFNQLSNAHTPAEQSLGQNTLQRAESFALMAQNIAKATGNLGLQAQAEKTLESITLTRVNAENALAATRAKDAKTATAADAAEKQRIAELKTLADDFISNSSAFDSKGNPLSPEKLTANFAKAKTDLQKFFALSGKQSPVNVSDLLSFDSLQTRLNQAVTGTELKQLKAAPDALDALFQQIQGAADKRAIAISFSTDPSKLKGSFGDILNQVQAQLASGGTNLSSQREAASANLNSQNVISGARAEATRSFNEGATNFEQSVIVLKTFLGSLAGRSPESQVLNAQLLGSIRQQIQQAIQNPNVQGTDVNRLSDALTDLQRNGGSVLATGLSRARNELDQLVTVFTEEQEQLRRAEQGLNPEGLQNAVDQLQQNIDRASSAFGNKFIDSGVFQSRQFGGPMYLATGGVARGTDTIPAMLSPGETVINAGSSRKFFSQLQSIQAGVAPSTPQAAGTTITNNVGDINIHSPDPKLSGEQVARVLNRSIRRGNTQVRK